MCKRYDNRRLQYLLVDESSLCWESVVAATLDTAAVDVVVVDKLHVDLQRRRKNLRFDEAEDVEELQSFKFSMWSKFIFVKISSAN